ncbi:MAG: hypothetical protein ABI824_15650 [Acidobacteriota bacterium]
MQNSENGRELEQALRQHLGRTSAPDDLWSRIRERRAADSVHSPITRPVWFGWASAAAALIVMVGGGWTAWRLYQPEVSVEAMAVEALTKGPEHLGIQSSDPREVRDWLKKNSNVDVPLPSILKSPDMQLVGAAILPGPQDQGGRPVAEVSYRVGDQQAELLISSNPSGTRTYPKHQNQEITPLNGAKVSSWSMRGQNYTLAWGAPSEFKAACLLCHTGSDAVLN